jgi:hypothetical protein
MNAVSARHNDNDTRPRRSPGTARARQRIAAQRAARQRAQARRRWLVSIAAVGAVLAIVVGFGGRYILAGAQYDPQVPAGLSQAQIASQLRIPGSPVAKAVDGSANVIIAAIDNVLHRQPGHPEPPR